MGFNPFRPRRARTGDMVMVAAALVIVFAAVAWALFG